MTSLNARPHFGLHVLPFIRLFTTSAACSLGSLCCDVTCEHLFLTATFQRAAVLTSAKGSSDAAAAAFISHSRFLITMNRPLIRRAAESGGRSAVGGDEVVGR